MSGVMLCSCAGVLLRFYMLCYGVLVPGHSVILLSLIRIIHVPKTYNRCPGKFCCMNHIHP